MSPAADVAALAGERGTVRTRARDARVAVDPAVLDEARRWTPLGRVAEPDDLAEAVGSLAGPLARSITGVRLPVDCGPTAGRAAVARTVSPSDHHRPFDREPPVG